MEYNGATRTQSKTADDVNSVSSPLPTVPYRLTKVCYSYIENFEDKIKHIEIKHTDKRHPTMKPIQSKHMDDLHSWDTIINLPSTKY